MEENTLLLFTTLLLFGCALSAPSEPSLVVTSTKSSNDSGKEGTSPNDISVYPFIYEMDITSNISNRFAKTLVVSKVKNSQTSAKEATFTVVLPEKAFISEFVMEIGGKSYKAYVKEKEEAKNIYNAAVQRGQSAAQVSVSARDSNKFTVSVNVEAESKAVFLLTYEELLQRKNDQYELVINLHPGQIVKKLNVQVHVNESRPLKYVRTPSLRSGNEISKNEDKLDPSSDIQIINSTTAVVKFNPGPEKQKEFAREFNTKESEGLSGQFVVQYEVERDPHGGEILLEDGYFVHFFAPNDLEPLPKHVVFVLDTSGSMYGKKIEQLKDAMKSILNDIKEGDLVNIITFDNAVQVWDINAKTKSRIVYPYNYDYETEPYSVLSEMNLPVPIVANNETLENAKSVIEELIADGGTNIIGGLETGLYLVGKVEQQRKQSEKKQPLIVFLTDGDPNYGVSSNDKIVQIVTDLNSKGNNVPIYSLSFGYGANKEFLRKLSLKNDGFSRHIYEASDASLQLQEFYKQISSPLLSNIKFKYTSDVKDVTKSKFPIYYGGSELVVTGRYQDTKAPFEGFTTCYARPGPRTLTPTIAKPVTSLERLWAYLTVKQILEERELADNKTELTKKALDLALKYSFVTDITSLVVVKPNDTSAVNTEEADKAPQYGTGPLAYPVLVPRTSGLMRFGSGSSRVRGYSARPSSFHSYYTSSKSAPYPQPVSAQSSISSSYPVQFQTYSGSSGLNAKSYAPRQPPVYMPASYYPQPVVGAGGYPGSAPFPGFPGPSSGFAIPYSTTTSTLKPRLEDTLPWLLSVLNPNGTITVSQGIYELGNTATTTVNTECPKTPLNSTEVGTCSLLKDCPQVHSALTDFQVYQQYFCPIDNKFAGVCCPKKPQQI